MFLRLLGSMIEKSRANEDTLGLCSVDFKKSKQFWKKVQLLGLTEEYKSNNQKHKRLILKMTSVGFTLQHLYIHLVSCLTKGSIPTSR